MPRTETIHKLSHALRLPLRVVQAAAMVTAGVSHEIDGATAKIALIAAHLTTLDATALRHVELFVNALVADAEASRG